MPEQASYLRITASVTPKDNENAEFICNAFDLTNKMSAAGEAMAIVRCIIENLRPESELMIVHTDNTGHRICGSRLDKITGNHYPKP